MTVISAMHLKIFKDINVHFNLFAFQFVKSSSKIQYKCLCFERLGSVLKGNTNQSSPKTNKQKDTQCCFKDFLKWVQHLLYLPRWQVFTWQKLPEVLTDEFYVNTIRLAWVSLYTFGPESSLFGLCCIHLKFSVGTPGLFLTCGNTLWEYEDFFAHILRGRDKVAMPG